METLIAYSPMILVFIVFWFFLIRPQKKQQQARQTMLGELKKGDKVVTIGGIHGQIIQINENQLRIKIADGVEIKTEKFAVDKVV